MQRIMTQRTHLECSIASDGWTDTAGHPRQRHVVLAGRMHLPELAQRRRRVKDATWLAKVLGGED
jgi:hypothetical protein